MSETEQSGRRHRLHEIIFEADTPAGRAFDISLIVAIIASVIVIMLDSVAGISAHRTQLFVTLEWIFTIFFTIEYILRLYCVRNQWRYARSFFGVIDLFSILPTYLSLILPGTQYFIVIRILRVLRVFRVLKLARHVGAAQQLARAMVAARSKITVFLLFVLTLVVILGSLMYLIEGAEAGFTSIPKAVYWSIVTLTTVGYGDISPQTSIGQALAALVMILGYTIIAVPTGIVSAELVQAARASVSSQSCEYCLHEDHTDNAKFCNSCGKPL
jgi:voltage-gated potassium channel